MRYRKSDRYHWPEFYRIYWRFTRNDPSLRRDDLILGLRLWSMVSWARFCAQPSHQRGRRPKAVRKRRSWASDRWRYFAQVHSPEGMRIWPGRLKEVRRWTAGWCARSVPPKATLTIDSEGGNQDGR